MNTSSFDRGIRNYKGTRDYFGDEMRWRQQIISTIQKVFEIYGFEPLETPVLETPETLKGKYGEEGQKKIFWLRARRPDDGGLRYDHTVPLARFMSMKWNEVIKPYKRYAIGPVFRLESTQAGRYRQFTQCDFDTVGSSDPIVDAEVIAINTSVLENLGFPEIYTVRINDRKLLNAMVGEIGLFDSKKVDAVFRAWDKLEKTSRNQITEELKEAGITVETIKSFDYVTDKLLAIADQPADVVLSEVSKLFPDSETMKDARNNIEELIQNIVSMGVSENQYKIWPTLARGLDYYTGPIFETVVEKQGIGSITGGGRFDNLIESLGGPKLPASGSSFGLERVMEVMENLDLRPETSQTTDVFVTIFEDDAQLRKASLETASKLRLTGYGVEVYTGTDSKLGKQIDIANRKSIPLVIIIGPDELNSGNITIKDLTRKRGVKSQYKVSTTEILTVVESLLTD